jgi:glycerol-3-phosphate O-acyltransferase
LKSRKEMMKIVLNAPGLCRTVEILAKNGEGDKQALQDKAKRYFLEIASDFDEKWLSIWEKVLSRLFRAIYDDFVVDQSGIAKIKEIALRMPFVIIPCHRSHIDYLIFSYILYKNGISLPLVAAGNNMNFWPLGCIFRQSGAFFLRRSFRGNELYSEVFATYVAALLQEEEPIEFFLEGGRSRTGKMAAPKYGMLSMLIRAYQDKVCDNLALIPVHLGYDRIIEEHSYLKELRGAPKKLESAIDVISHIKIMMSRYGRAYINIGEPMFLKDYFAAQHKSYADMTYDEKQSLYRDIGHRISGEINRVSVATPVSLVAASLLCHGGKETSKDQLRETFNAFCDYLNHKKVNLAPTLAEREKTLPEVLKLFNQRGCLFPRGAGKEEKGLHESYLLPAEKRLNLEYYKNNIVHHFLPISFVALSILSCREKEIAFRRLRDDYIFLKKLFSQEFILGDEEDIEIRYALSYMENLGIVSREGENTWKQERGLKNLMPFSGLFQSYMESYWVALNYFSSDKKGLTGARDLPNYLWQKAEEMYGKGEIQRLESLSQENYKNALKLLQEEGVLSSKTARGNATGEDEFSIADQAHLETLRLRLSRFMGVNRDSAYL